MLSYYSIDIPKETKNIISENVRIAESKSNSDVNYKFKADKYELHMTFIYFGDEVLKRIDHSKKVKIDELIRSVKFNVRFEYDDVDLYRRFFVLKYKSTDPGTGNDIITVRDQLLREIYEIIGDKDTVELFAKNNYYDISSQSYTRVWNPHITIGTIRMPTKDYCSRNKINMDEWISEIYKNTKRHLKNLFVSPSDLSFNASLIS